MWTGEINKKFWEKLITYFPCYDTDRIENNASYNYSIVSCVFVAAAKFSPSPCLATMRATNIDAQTMGGIYEVRCWDRLMYDDIGTKFHKDWFSQSNVDRGDTQTAWWSH
jgi:hypothetical protein